jgi:hypothetical protein
LDLRGRRHPGICLDAAVLPRVVQDPESLGEDVLVHEDGRATSDNHWFSALAGVAWTLRQIPARRSFMKLHARHIGTGAVTAALAALFALGAPEAAQAHGYHVYGPHFWFGLGFYAPFYAGPYAYPYYAYPYYGFPARDLEAARSRGLGALELHVKPGKAEVRVDGSLAGEAGDFDGSPSLLWLRKGSHRIKVSLPGYETFDEEYSVAPGEVFEVHLKMKKG